MVSSSNHARAIAGGGGRWVTYLRCMASSKVLRELFRGLARASKTFHLRVGPIEASGVPAILVAVTGVVLAGGIAHTLARNADRLPETLKEARGLAESLRERKALNP